jgi:tRNA nucleotidyltransferase (CCA-adding enzyme)
MLRVASLFVGEPFDRVRATLRALRYSNADVNGISRLVTGCAAVAAPMTDELVAEVPSDGVIRRWVAATGRTQWGLVARLVFAQWSAARGTDAVVPSAAQARAVYRRGVRIAYRDPIELADLAVDGDDLRAFGVAGGPELGRVLQRLLALVIEDPSLNTREQLLARAIAP